MASTPVYANGSGKDAVLGFKTWDWMAAVPKTPKRFEPGPQWSHMVRLERLEETLKGPGTPGACAEDMCRRFRRSIVDPAPCAGGPGRRGWSSLVPSPAAGESC